MDKEHVVFRVWNGDESLAKTYWLYGMAISMAIGLIIALINPEPGSDSAKQMAFALGMYITWQSVGMWRSAEKYQGRAIWCVLAKIASVLGFLCVAGMLAAFLTAK